MTRKNSPDLKADALQKNGVFNSKANQITDPLFHDNEFFDPEDLIQAKYEMLRRVHKDGMPVSNAANAFGISRVSFYKAQAALRRNGLQGLLPKKSGPHSGYKITAEIQAFIRDLLSKDQFMEPSAILAMVQKHFKVVVHLRTIKRVSDRLKKKRL